jgi:NADPH-dependent 2,4-dienoyl-CoA reductase/sulfur reductase-like enzyme
MQVLVVGAGVVGLAVARTAVLRGHDVIVAEAGGDGAPDPGQLLRMRKVVAMRSRQEASLIEGMLKSASFVRLKRVWRSRGGW